MSVPAGCFWVLASWRTATTTWKPSRRKSSDPWPPFCRSTPRRRPFKELITLHSDWLVKLQLSVHFPVWLSVCPSVCWSVCLSISDCWYVCLSISVCWSVRLSISVYWLVGLTVCLSGLNMLSHCKTNHITFFTEPKFDSKGIFGPKPFSLQSGMFSILTIFILFHIFGSG